MYLCMRKTLRLFFLGWLALCGLSGAMLAQPVVRYVTETGTGDGTSWTHASGDLQAMIDASQAGDEVWIASGVYKPQRLIKDSKKRSTAFFLKNGVSLYGGFKGDETSKEERERLVDGKPYDWVNQTVLSGDDEVPDVWTRELDPSSTHRYVWRVEGNEGNSNHILYAADRLSERTVIDGLILQGAYADVWQAEAGGAALWAAGHVELSACRIVENMAYNKVEGKVFGGGAVYLADTGGLARIESCLFERNQVRASYEAASGGAVYGEKVSVSGSVFKGCVSFDYAGAVYNKNGIVSDCVFEDCYGGSGGAVFNEGSMESCIVYDCRALKGGAVYNTGTVNHCIVANCYADTQDYGDSMGGSGGGIYMTDGKVVGSLVYNCSAFEGGGVYVKWGKIVNTTVQHCAVRKPAVPHNVSVEPESETCVFNTIGNPDADVSNFVAPTGFTGIAQTAADSLSVRSANWQLTPESEFRDTGKLTDGVTEETDLAGNPRISGESIDVGAYEYVVSASQEPDIVLTFAEAGREVKIGTGGNAGTTFRIDWGDGELQPYEGAVYAQGTPVNGVVKIYGDELLILQVVDQGLVELDVRKAEELGRIQIGYNRVQKLDLSSNVSLTGLYCEENLLESLDVSRNRSLRVLDCHKNRIAGTLDCAAMTALTKLDCSDNQIENLYLPSTATLTDIDCGVNRLEKLDVSGLSALEVLSCNDNLLTELDLSANASLYDLYCPDNRLVALNLLSNRNLEKLSANGNELTEVDLSENTKLTGLYLQNNALAELDLSANTAVSWLNVENNRLKEVGLTSLGRLSLLNVAHNELTALDLSGNPYVNTLHAGNNQLSELCTSAQKSLVWLTCDSNYIDRLDLSANSYVSWLECENNRLTELDVTGLPNLQKLFAGNNRLTTLDLSENPGIQGVLVANNQMNKETLDALMKVLPDVSQVEIHENNVAWAKQLDISGMSGTQAADKALAESKGWMVRAEGGSSVDPTEGDAAGWWYDAGRKMLCHTERVYDICIYSGSGMLIRQADSGTRLSVESLPEGMYIAVGRDADGRKLICRFVR